MTNTAEPIELSPANTAFSELTPHYGGMCCEAAAFCLSENGHSNPVDASLRGCSSSTAQLAWLPPSTKAIATYRDRDVAAENGAYAVAIALLNKTHGYQVVERSAKGTGFDFWLGKAKGALPFSEMVRLEVSGIFDGRLRVSARLSQKLKQMNPTDATATGFAIVAEFSGPIVAVGEKEVSSGHK
ncbi:hypothetical protein [Cupriavidus campinensis]|uniref:Uncharacterized protein n=1 Tax=Cupriavidus campinensis TaxID=151783 RepID=A0ABY3EIH9_9BURK|nr:hypothetical protein [Cupriavidus campinensis]TSP10654.1 hypothetical protein FGG12_21420 [Cupriavidus campinensis]